MRQVVQNNCKRNVILSFMFLELITEVLSLCYICEFRCSKAVSYMNQVSLLSANSLTVASLSVNTSLVSVLSSLSIKLVKSYMCYTKCLSILQVL